MSFTICYIKNIDSVNHTVIGTVLEPNDIYQVLDEKRLAISNNGSILAKITNDQLQIGTSASDFISDYNDQIEHLKNIVPGTVQIDGVTSTTNIQPTSLDSKLRVDFSSTEVSLNAVDSSYNTIYTYSGAGRLHSFFIDFNSDRVLCKLEIDGETIFDIDCEDLENILPNGEDLFDFSMISWSNSKNSIIFNPKFPIKYSTSVTISAKSNSSSTSRDVDGYIISITKDS